MTRPLAVDADALAAEIREQSERTIRAHAHRLVAGRRDALRLLSDDERRTELLSLGERVAKEEPHADALAASVLPHLTRVSNATRGFELLVDALTERAQFVTDPEAWLTRRDFPMSDRAWQSMDDSTLAAVDEALDALIGGQR